MGFDIFKPQYLQKYCPLSTIITWFRVIFLGQLAIAKRFDPFVPQYLHTNFFTSPTPLCFFVLKLAQNQVVLNITALI